MAAEYRLPYTAQEFEEKLSKLKDADQTYDFNSENAQSGKAVAEALENSLFTFKEIDATNAECYLNDENAPLPKGIYEVTSVDYYTGLYTIYFESGYFYLYYDKEIPGLVVGSKFYIELGEFDNNYLCHRISKFAVQTADYVTREVFDNAIKNPILNYIDYEIVNSEAVITYCKKSIFGDHIIPETIDGYPVTDIGTAFLECANLTGITIPGTIKTVGDYAFSDCFGLISVIFSEGVTKLEGMPFEDCGSIKFVAIPESLTFISDGAFDYASITDVYYAGSEEQWNNITFGEFTENLTNATIHYNQAPAKKADVIEAIDQSYSPESKNAQSGKAVNEALSVFEEIPTDDTISFVPYNYETIYDASHNGIYEITDISAEGEFTMLSIGVDSINISKPSYLLPDLTVGSKIYIEFGEQWAFDSYYLNKLVVVRDKYATEEALKESLFILKEFSNVEGSSNYVSSVITTQETVVNGTYTITEIYGDGINYLSVQTEIGYFDILNPTYKMAVGDKIYIEFGERLEPYPDAPWLYTKLALVTDKFVTEEVLQESTSETWDTIYDLELSEDAVVYISYDLNEHPINLKKFKILVEMPFVEMQSVTSATTLWLKMNDILAIKTHASSASAISPSYSISAEYTFDWQYLTCVNDLGAHTDSQIYTTPYGHRHAAGSISFPCRSIGLAFNSAFTQGLPEGTKVRIWGVRA